MAMHRAKEGTKDRHTNVSPIEETKVPDDDDEEEEAPLQRAIRMAKELREKSKNNARKQTAARLTKVSRPSELMAYDEENEDQNIPSDINELRVKKNQNLLDLQNLTNMLKSRQDNYRDDIDEQDDDLERATVQEFAE